MLHYILYLRKFFITEDIGVNILSRNQPWDFKLELSNGKIFNLEITSIADNPRHFELNKREERFLSWTNEDTIPLQELEIISSMFPYSNFNTIIKKYKNEGFKGEDNVENPLFGSSTWMFVSNNFKAVDALDTQIHSVITKKVKKIT
ncbi:MAG: hypothetical protein GWO07_02925 [Candidatus Dadabacteria bacterium]|nr:hypothetical protein [Candidatus Dadabacteria bacterium]NIS07720.1 hypothetical protein [Candidatus Dadabacteria bacterium]NIV42325.1 hypothetical protein [Candidatus Dadabacteria bacterium]NIY21361.1 hypothetical protein [Candidatus Dadabacteria bacterium]